MSKTTLAPVTRISVPDQQERFFHSPPHRTWREKVKNYASAFFNSSSLMAATGFSLSSAAGFSRLTGVPVFLSGIGMLAIECISFQLLSRKNLGPFHVIRNPQENTPGTLALGSGMAGPMFLMALGDTAEITPASLVRMSVATGIASIIFFNCFMRAKIFSSQGDRDSEV